jgi:hypothetical protein
VVFWWIITSKISLFCSQGKLPFFVPPPRTEGDEDDNADLADDEPAVVDMDEDDEDDADGDDDEDVSVVDSGDDEDVMEQDEEEEQSEAEEEEVVVPVVSTLLRGLLLSVLNVFCLLLEVKSASIKESQEGEHADWSIQL